MLIQAPPLVKNVKNPPAESGASDLQTGFDGCVGKERDRIITLVEKDESLSNSIPAVEYCLTPPTQDQVEAHLLENVDSQQLKAIEDALFASITRYVELPDNVSLQSQKAIVDIFLKESPLETLSDVFSLTAKELGQTDSVVVLYKYYESKGIFIEVNKGTSSDDSTELAAFRLKPTGQINVIGHELIAPVLEAITDKRGRKLIRKKAHTSLDTKTHVIVFSNECPLPMTEEACTRHTLTHEGVHLAHPFMFPDFTLKPDRMGPLWAQQSESLAIGIGLVNVGLNPKAELKLAINEVTLGGDNYIHALEDFFTAADSVCPELVELTADRLMGTDFSIEEMPKDLTAEKIRKIGKRMTLEAMKRGQELSDRLHTM